MLLRTAFDIVMIVLTGGIWIIWMVYRQHKINARLGAGR